MAEKQKRGALGNGDRSHSTKKPRAPAVQDGDEVKEDGEEVSQVSDGDRAVVPVVAMEEPQISLIFGVSLFHCQTCLLPLKPPTFKCEAAEHVVCGACRGTHGQVCSRAATFAPCRELDAVVLDAKLPCQYADFGCKSLVVYYQAADHHNACPSAPCFCPAPDCEFVSSPARLAGHFRDLHSWPVTGFSYGRPRKLPVPAPEGWHVLVAEGDGAVFLVSASALGAATAVSLVRVTANGAAATGAGQFWCKLWVELPTRKNKMVMITSTVCSSDLSRGFPGPDEDMFLVVPPVLLHDASGEAPELMVLIDKPKAAAPKSASPPSRSPRMPQ